MPPPGFPAPGSPAPGSPAPGSPAPGSPAPGSGFPTPPPFGSPPPSAPPGYGPASGAQPPPPGYQPFPPGAGGGYGYEPTNPATRFGTLAGFWVRFGGYLLDGLLYGLVFAAGLVPGIVLIIRSFDDCIRIDAGNNSTEIVCVGDQLDVGLLVGGISAIFVAFVVVVVLYLRALARTGQTWGRRIAGIKVINEQTGGPPGWGKAIGRSAFAGIISAQIFYVGYLWMLWDDKKQTLHDKVAGTHVISADPPSR